MYADVALHLLMHTHIHRCGDTVQLCDHDVPETKRDVRLLELDA